MTITDSLIGSMAMTVPLLFGLLVVRWLPEVRWVSRWPARLALGHLVGCGAMAWVTTAYAVASGRLRVLPFYALLFLAGAATWSMRAKLPLRSTFKVESRTQRSAWRTLAIAVVILGIVTATSALIANDNLTMDAHWNWALKAKAFLLARSLSPIAEGCCTHPNYPILIPLQSWWVYSHLHHAVDFWPKAVGWLFYMDVLALAFAACRTEMESTWAWIVTAIVANDVTQVLNAPRGMADSAVAAYILASSLFLAAYFARRDRTSRMMALLMLAGVLQTKNEGIAWAALATAFLVIFECRNGLYKRAATSAIWVLLAAAPWTFFKHAHRFRNGPEEQMATLHTLRVEALLRVKTIAVAHLANFGPHTLPFFLVLCGPMIFYGWRWISKPVLALIAAQFTAYLAVYFVVADQIYQLSFMLRAISQLSPTLLCLSLNAWQARKTALPTSAASPVQGPGVDVLSCGIERNGQSEASQDGSLA